MDLVERLLKGDTGAAARLISMAEDEDPKAAKALSVLHAHTGKAQIIGVTGPPGAGKSTVIDQAVRIYRKKGRRVGILAIDPTSPFTGGAILGDRIRMQQHSTDPGVFIRSMGTRGWTGGLSKATASAIKILDALGMDPIIVETVGAGQSEVEVVRSAHSVLIVEVPGLGDDIQAFKAGILEIGDVFVVNKADRDGADKAVADLRAMLETCQEPREWTPPVLKCSARDGAGIEEVVDALDSHFKLIKKSGAKDLKDRRSAEREFMDVLRDRLAKYITEKVVKKGEFDALVERILRRQMDPYSAAEKLLEPIEKEAPKGKRK